MKELDLSDFKIIDIPLIHQPLLLTNVFCINDKHVITRDIPEGHEVNRQLEDEGWNVIPIKFNGTPMLGGSFRCATAPLHRE
jgi:N-dimethylarginine dimethylaminohydrolase